MACQRERESTSLISRHEATIKSLTERVEALEKTVQDFDDQRDELTKELQKVIPCRCRSE